MRGGYLAGMLLGLFATGFIACSAAGVATPSPSTVPEQNGSAAPSTPTGPSANFGSSYAGEGADSPEGAVRLMLEGISENNENKVLDATDPAFRSAVIGPGNFRLLLQGVFAIFTGADLGQLDISFRDLSLSTAYEPDPNYATVYVSGRVRALGREEVLSNDPTPTVRKFGRWFVTTVEGSYAGQVERPRQTAVAKVTATAQAEAAQEATAAARAVEETPITPIKVTVQEGVNLREEPFTDAAVLGSLLPGDEKTAVAKVRGQPLEPGNDIWYQLEDGSFVWSAAVKEVAQ